MEFSTYILYSATLDKYYIGSTGDLPRRLTEHNRGKTAFARRGMPWELVHSEQFDSRRAAYQRELEIKRKKSRRYIEWLIAS